MPTLLKPISCFVTSSTRSNALIRTLSKSCILSINHPLLAGPARWGTSVASLSRPTSPLPKRAIRSRCSYAVRRHLHLARSARLFLLISPFPCLCLRVGGIGPPGQVIAVAGKKDGVKQGVIGGMLKELGYTEEQVFKF